MAYTGFRNGKSHYDLRCEFKTLKEAKVYKNQHYAYDAMRIEKAKVSATYWNDCYDED
jgi:serine/threonine-protein kinase RIO1